jgi:putative peptidoglycan lipid II flippase
LAAFALGLPSFVLIKVLQPAFFAREDTRTPMRYAIWNMFLNVAGSIALFLVFKLAGFMPHVGIALATSLSGWVNAGMLWAALKKRGHFAVDVRLRQNVLSISLASLGMGAVIWVMAAFLGGYLTPETGVGRQACALALVLTAGLVVYACAIQVSGVMRWGEFLRRLARRTQ